MEDLVVPVHVLRTQQVHAQFLDLLDIWIDDNVVDEALWAVLDDVLSFESSTTFSMTADPKRLTDDVKEMRSYEDSSVVDENVEKQPLRATCSSHSAIGKRSKESPTSNPARRRKRPKDELDYLRVKVADMEKELLSLQPKPEIGSPATVSAPVILRGDADTSQELTRSWKRIAERQKLEVDRSIVENMRLRAMLEEQLKVAKCLESAIDLFQREATQSLPPFGSMNVDFTSMSDELIFAHLSANLETQYAELESDFKRCGIRHETDEIKTETKVHVDSDGLLISHGDVQFLPFSQEAVHRAIWSIVRYSTAKDVMAGTMESKVVDKHHVNVILTEKLKLKDGRVVRVVRKYSFWRAYETHRSVILWNSYVEMDGSVSVQLRERGYFTTSPYTFGTQPNSVIRLAKVSRPQMTGLSSLEGQKAHIGEVTELVVGTVRSVMRFLHHITDTLLRREAMGDNLSEDA